ncbi:MAG: hypothetical protein DRI90_21750 [Deltaproteobacteria bacterium]|nr:MAG: hypothetical protein DRI90_21750 [Deltaproteobacteria bacterium]
MSNPDDRARPRPRPKRRPKRRARRAVPEARTAATGLLAGLTQQRRLALSGSTTVMGLALVGVGESLVGAVVVLAGLVALMFSIHKYGRLGVERAPRR